MLTEVMSITTDELIWRNWQNIAKIADVVKIAKIAKVNPSGVNTNG